MSQTIALAENYLPLIDEVYKVASRSAVLDTPSVQFVNANAIKYFKMTMQGAGNYSRNNGFAHGDVTGTWETLPLTYDRGREFMIDAMDNDETIGQAFGRLAGEYLRTQQIPELDAYTFAKIAAKTGILGANGDVTPGTTELPTLINNATAEMNEKEVPYEGRYLFISETAYQGLQEKITREVYNADENIKRTVLMYDNMEVIRVPQTRFYTNITMRDGTTSGQEAGGYVGTPTTGYKINFMIVHPSAIVKVTKHALPRIFSPEVNQKSDGWLFQYRLYGDTFVLDNKTDGVYMHRAATPLA